MGLNVLSYQFHLSQCCHPACGHEGSCHLSPVLALPTFKHDMRVQHSETNRYGTTKIQNEEISVGHFCGKRAMGANKTEMVRNFFVGRCFFLWSPTEEMSSFLEVATEKTQTYGTVHTFRSTVQNLPLTTRCAQGGPNNSNYCHSRRSSSRGQAPRLFYLTCKLSDHLWVDGMDGENILLPDEEIAAAAAVGASVIEHWSTVIVSGIAAVWSG